jgi:hypothetical protein
MPVAEDTCKRLSVLFVVLVTIAASVVLTAPAIADVAAQAQVKTLDRDLEPVIVRGSAVPSLNGVPVADLYVYKFNGDSLDGPIPAQVDEITNTGLYTTTDNLVLDDRDEVVFMAKDLGDRPASTVALLGLPINANNWYEIEVADPLSLDKKGWAYLVQRSSSVPVSGDYVDYSEGNKHITADQYEVGFATAFPGLNYLALNGNSTNILDRTKIRVRLGILGFTEEALGSPQIVEVKDGPVRVILRQTGMGTLGSSAAEARSTYLAYASLLQVTASVNFTLSVSDLNSVRTSVDFSSAVYGATFYNANTPSGVTIDGNPDTVAATPLSNWSQVSHTTGRLVQVFDPTPAGGTPQDYYCDNSTSGTECDDTSKTGDGFSYGDAGLLVDGNVNHNFSVESWFFVLSPNMGQNVGTTYLHYYSNRLKPMAFLQADRKVVYLPVILENTQ